MNNKALPKRIEEHIKRNTTFNMFGLINLNTLPRTSLTREELKRRINERFSKEVNGKIEFKE